MRPHGSLGTALLLALLAATPVRGEDDAPSAATLSSQLRDLDVSLAPAASEEARQFGEMLARDARARIALANQRESEAWSRIRTREAWERYRDARVKALRESLGSFPALPVDLKVRIVRTLDGDKYQIRNIVFESRPGVVVTANLYLPSRALPSLPGILICHSHHNPKTQGELQDMGMTWAREGCAVLVMDQLGHGERRQHPFVTAKDHPGPFRVGRQDYYFRYKVGMQLHLIGDSLIGWMAWDLMRGVDLLLAQPGVDRERIILLGAVAGGGDPAAVTAALDPRIAAAVPFNFGGPQPETVYPLPEGAETSFNYAGSGSWESTRNLRLSARDGFLPWVIVGAIAPRRLIYAHEFAWDRDRDPVWKRLERIYRFYQAQDHLAAATGRGRLSGQPPESTHCNNIGAEHRQGIYPALEQWFRMPVPEKEYQRRHAAADLLCLSPEVQKELKPRPLHAVAAEIALQRLATIRRRLALLGEADRRQRLRHDWAARLGDVEPKGLPRVTAQSGQRLGAVAVERLLLEVEPQTVVPLVVLMPPPKEGVRPPVVIGLSQHGKQVFLKERAAGLAALLESGVAVVLPDVRGTGETRPGDGRGRTSAATSISSTELMLGQTLVGSRLRDLRSVLRYLRTRKDLDASRLALWGDSFAPDNAEDRNVRVPLDADRPPHLAEPLGGLLALFGALFEDDVKAVHVRGGLVSYASLLESPFVHVPHDIIVPGALTAGDLDDVAAALAPRPVRLEGPVDGHNRRVKRPRETEPSGDAAVAKWLVEQLRR